MSLCEAWIVTDTRRYRTKRQVYHLAIPSVSAAGPEACKSALYRRDMEAGLKEKWHIAACLPGTRVVPKEETRGTDHSQ